MSNQRKEKFKIDDFDDPEIRNLVYKLNGIMEDIDDLEYEQEEHESILQSLKENMKTLKKQAEELEAEINSLTLSKERDENYSTK